jgi:hypothetical protein
VIRLENLQPGRAYAVDCSAGLEAAGWTPAWQFESAGGATNWPDATGGTNARCFFRVRRTD